MHPISCAASSAVATFVSIAFCAGTALARKDVELPADLVRLLVIEARENDTAVTATREPHAWLTVHKRAWAAGCRVESVSDGESWSVRAPAQPGCSVDLEFHVPAGTSLSHSSTTGALVVDGLRGELRAASMSGAIKVVTGARKIRLSSDDGDIALTLEGEIGEAPKVHVSTVTGAVRIKAQQGVQSAALFVTTESGHATVELPQTARLELLHDEPATNESVPANAGRFLLRSCGNIDVLLRAGYMASS